MEESVDSPGWLEILSGIGSDGSCNETDPTLVICSSDNIKSRKSENSTLLELSILESLNYEPDETNITNKLKLILQDQDEGEIYIQKSITKVDDIPEKDHQLVHGKTQIVEDLIISSLRDRHEGKLPVQVFPLTSLESSSGRKIAVVKAKLISTLNDPAETSNALGGQNSNIQLGSMIGALDAAGSATMSAVAGLSYAATTGASSLSQALSNGASSASTVVSAVPGVSHVAGLATESILFTADRASHFIDKCMVDLVQDSPEVVFLRESSALDTDWDSEGARRRCLLPTLPWLERQLLTETRDKYSAVVVLPLKQRGGPVPVAGSSGVGACTEDSDQSFLTILGTERPLVNQSASPTSIALANGRDTDPRRPKLPGASSRGLLSRSEGDGEGESDEEVESSTIQTWLAREAAAGDEEAQYSLARWCSRPAWREASVCHACEKSFGMTRFRHHCRCCGNSFCGEHSSERRSILQFGYTTPVRVCGQCARGLDHRHREDLVQWRVLRVRAYLRNQLLPYFPHDVDRIVDKAKRFADGSLYVVRNTLSLSYYAKLGLQAIDLLSRFGMTGLTGVLLRNDFVEAAETLKKISNLDVTNPLSLHELTACIYYKLALDRGLRGCDPEGEHCMHSLLDDQDTQAVDLTPGEGEGWDGVSASELDSAIRFAPFALEFVYVESPTDMQRLASQQGYSTIAAHINAGPEKPAFALFAPTLSSETAAPCGDAILAIRGTLTLHDIVTDIRTNPQRFQPPQFILDEALAPRHVDRLADDPLDEAAMPASEPEWEAEQWDWDAVPPGESYVCGGVFRAALWVLRSVGPALVELHDSGHRVVIVGHSLGAAVAVLLTALLRPKLSDGPGLHCWAYGCPSCVDEALAEALTGSVTTVVLHDDVIPRFTPNSIRGLMRDLLIFRERVFKFVEDDWADLLKRASQLWSPRWRCDLSPLQDKREQDLSPLPNIETEAMVHVPVQPLADVWLPGRVVHIYPHRGVYRIRAVPRDFLTLRRIEVQGNIFENHKSKSIMEALLEVRSVRNAPHQPPVWTAFNETDLCQRCQSPFTWHTTCQGKAQSMRERHNCRCCGALVCGPCSSHREVIVRFGFRTTSRICDRCYYGGLHSL